MIDRVYPRIVGNDIGCGMRLDVLDIKQVEITDELKDKLRGVYFEGKREVFVKNRKQLLQYGLIAENNLYGSSVEALNSIKSIRCYNTGSMNSGDLSEILSPYIELSNERDNLLGTIAGGNHFVELQIVDEIVDRHQAYDLGLRLGSICVMTHSGSLDNGHQVGNYYKDLARSKHDGKYPENGYFSLQDNDAQMYFIAAQNATNFATVNRAVLASMMAQVFNCSLNMVYDCPHNFLDYYDKNLDQFLHRKGACSAKSNEIVIVPGSMGTRSCVLSGSAFENTLSSAPHGAGRVLNRNNSRKTSDQLNKLHIVTKIDTKSTRSDIVKEIMKNLNEEAPNSYKNIDQVINTVQLANIAQPVAWLKPLLTLKG